MTVLGIQWPAEGSLGARLAVTSNEAADSSACHSASVFTTLSTSIGPWLTPASVNMTMVTLAGAAAMAAFDLASSPRPPSAHQGPQQ